MRAAEVYFGLTLIVESIGAWIIYLSSGKTLGGWLLYALGLYRQAIAPFEPNTSNATAFFNSVFSNAALGIYLIEGFELILEPLIGLALIWDGLSSGNRGGGYGSYYSDRY